MRHAKPTRNIAFPALAALVFSGVALFGSTASATVIDASTTPLNFHNTTDLGVQAPVGTTISYSNVLSGVDAKVTFVSKSSARTFVREIDRDRTDPPRSSLDLRFNTADGTTTYPWNDQGNLGHQVNFKIDFFAAGTNNPVQLGGFSVLAVDVDNLQGAEFKGATSGVMASSSPLVREITSEGIKIVDISGDDSLVTDKLYWAVWNYEAPVSSLEFSIFSGYSGVNAFPLEFGAVNWDGLATTTSYAPPKAVNNNYTTAFESPVNGFAATGDTYRPGSTFAQTSSPANGTVVWNNDGSFTYTPNAGFSGTDSFTYEITAPDGQKASATQFISVQAQVVSPPAAQESPQAPVPMPASILVAVDDSYSTPLNTPLSGAAGTGDSYPVGSTFAQTSQPQNGTVEVWNSDGTYTYTPNTGFIGTDSFTYEITAPDGQKASATQFISVEAVVEPKVPVLAQTGGDLSLQLSTALSFLALGLALLLGSRKRQRLS